MSSYLMIGSLFSFLGDPAGFFRDFQEPVSWMDKLTGPAGWGITGPRPLCEVTVIRSSQKQSFVTKVDAMANHLVLN